MRLVDNTSRVKIATVASKHAKSISHHKQQKYHFAGSRRIEMHDLKRRREDEEVGVREKETKKEGGRRRFKAVSGTRYT